MLFAGWSSSRVASATVSNYISGVRSRAIELGWGQFDRDKMPKLQRLLKGYAAMQKDQNGGHVRLAMTFSILSDLLSKKLQREVDARANGHVESIYSLESFTLASALYTSLFVGLHRPSELTVRRTSKGETLPLRVKHFTFRMEGNNVTGATVSIPKTKCDNTGQRSVVEYGPTKHHIVCAVSRLHDMWTGRRLAGEVITPESFLFAIKGASGELRPITYDDLRKQLVKDLDAAGYDSATYLAHSFRIGAASTLHANGVPHSIIEDLGRWVRGSLSIPLYLRGIAAPEMRRRMHSFFAKPYLEAEAEEGCSDELQITAAQISALLVAGVQS